MTLKTEIRKNGSRRVSKVISPKSKVEQSHKDRCDINIIMSKYRQTGVVPLAQKTALYGDFTNATDFHTAVNKVQAAHQAFERMPAAVKKRFGQDPGQMIDFLADPANIEEAVELGLMEKIGNDAQVDGKANQSMPAGTTLDTGSQVQQKADES